MATLQELRDLTPQELKNRAGELKVTLFELRNKANTGVLESTADLIKTKRDIARCLTVAREKELAEARAVAAAKPRTSDLAGKE
jgi:large subunit ribosomal protein L29